MKKIIQLLAISVLAISIQGCFKDKCQSEITYIKQTPVFLTIDEMRVAPNFETPRKMEKPGKIAYFNNHLFINEIREGIHVIDNNDPENPVNIGFINIPGNVDMFVANNILYADSYIDLLSIDITDITNPGILDREENLFPVHISNQKHLVYYELEEITETIDCGSRSSGDQSDLVASSGASFDSNGGGFPDGGFGDVGASAETANGIVGSLSRFSVIGGFLYIVDDRSMHIYDISNASDLRNTGFVNLGFGIETIFPYGDHIFIGSNTGMLIYDNTDPTSPTFVADFEHARACDPVFVKDDYAYVTLRGGSTCQNFTNQMDVIDISNIENPTLARSIQLENPHGLSLKDNNLFVCEGDFGFKTFDNTNPLELASNMKSEISSPHSYDVISLPGQANIIMIIGEDGFYQYDVSDISSPKRISSILVEN